MTITQQANHELNHQLRQAQHRGQPVLFLASGGSALKLLEEIDLETITLLAAQLTIGVLDERYSSAPKINNFCQLMQTRLFQDAQATGAIFLDTRPQPAETAPVLATRWETSLKAWRREHPTGQLIITQGMGEDGHTSGMMPFPENQTLFAELFDQPDHWVTSYDAGSKNPFPLRVTTTCSFLRQVDVSIFFVTGENKRAALERVYAPIGTLAETPARVVREIGQVILCSDQPAR